MSVSPLGTMLDPIADKLLVALLLLYLLLQLGMPALLAHRDNSAARALYVSGLREFLAARQIALPVSQRRQTQDGMLQMLAITVLLGRFAFNPPHQLNFPLPHCAPKCTG